MMSPRCCLCVSSWLIIRRRGRLLDLFSSMAAELSTPKPKPKPKPKPEPKPEHVLLAIRIKRGRNIDGFVFDPTFVAEFGRRSGFPIRCAEISIQRVYGFDPFNDVRGNALHLAHNFLQVRSGHRVNLDAQFLRFGQY